MFGPCAIKPNPSPSINYTHIRAAACIYMKYFRKGSIQRAKVIEGINSAVVNLNINQDLQQPIRTKKNSVWCSKLYLDRSKA